MEGRKYGGVSNNLETGKHYIFRKMQVTGVHSTCHKVAPDKAGEIWRD